MSSSLACTSREMLGDSASPVISNLRRKPGMMGEGMVGVRGRGKFGWKLLLVGPWARGMVTQLGGGETVMGMSFVGDERVSVLGGQGTRK